MTRHRYHGECSNCGGERDRPGQRYCRRCHRDYVRTHRPRHADLTDEQRRRANARSYANTYKQRGKLIPEPCEVCGSTDVEMHHDDYSRPLDVRWLCRVHHIEHEHSR